MESTEIQLGDLRESPQGSFGVRKYADGGTPYTRRRGYIFP